MEHATRDLVSCPQMHAGHDPAAACAYPSGFKVLTTSSNRPKRPPPPPPVTSPIGAVLQQAYAQPVGEALPDSMTALLAKLRY